MVLRELRSDGHLEECVLDLKHIQLIYLELIVIVRIQGRILRMEDLFVIYHQ